MSRSRLGQYRILGLRTGLRTGTPEIATSGVLGARFLAAVEEVTPEVVEDFHASMDDVVRALAEFDQMEVPDPPLFDPELERSYRSNGVTYRPAELPVIRQAHDRLDEWLGKWNLSCAPVAGILLWALTRWNRQEEPELRGWGDIAKLAAEDHAAFREYILGPERFEDQLAQFTGPSPLDTPLQAPPLEFCTSPASHDSRRPEDVADEVLEKAMLAVHRVKPGDVLPDDVLKRLIEGAKDASGLGNLMGVVLARTRDAAVDEIGCVRAGLVETRAAKGRALRAERGWALETDVLEPGFEPWEPEFETMAAYKGRILKAFKKRLSAHCDELQEWAAEKQLVKLESIDDDHLRWLALRRIRGCGPAEIQRLLGVHLAADTIGLGAKRARERLGLQKVDVRQGRPLGS